MPSTRPHEAAGATCVPGRSFLLSWTRLTPLYAPHLLQEVGIPSSLLLSQTCLTPLYTHPTHRRSRPCATSS